MHFRIFGLLLLMCLSRDLQAQRPEYTSADLPDLVRKINSSDEDSSKIWYLLKAANLYTRKPGEADSDLDSALLFVRHAEKLSDTYGREDYKLQCEFWKGAVFLERQQWDQGREVLQAVALKYSKIEDKFNQALALHRLGTFLPRSTQELSEEKLALLLKASQLYDEVGQKELYLDTKVYIAELQLLMGQPDSALVNISDALSGLLSIDGVRTLHAYQIAIEVHEYYGNYDRAIEYSLAALKRSEAKGLNQWKYFFYDKLGDVYTVTQDAGKASEMYALRLQEAKLHYPSYVYYGLHEMIIPMVQSGKVAEALEMINSTTDQFPTEDGFYKKIIAFCLALCYEKRGETELAERHFLASISPSESNINEFSFNNYVSEFYLRRRQFEEAKKSAGEIFVATGVNTLVRSRAYLNLYKADSAMGDYLSALRHQQNYIDLQRNLTDETKRKQVELLSIEFETQKKDREIEFKNQSIEMLSAQTVAQSRLQKATFIGAALIVIILLLVYRQYRLKQKSNQKLLLRQLEIDRKNEELQQLVEEKELLLKEVHHRVKNNLQTVLSLLESQSRQLSNEAFDAIQDSQNRVYAMSLIHKKLYQSSDVTSINMEEYLTELIQHLRDSLMDSNDVTVSMNLDPVELDVSQAVPIGLIVNEAITNSIKYAFPLKSRGNQISVSLNRRENQQIELILSDNGIGMQTDKKVSGSLGLKLMKGLTEDIEGDFSIQSDHGVHISVGFVASERLDALFLTSA